MEQKMGQSTTQDVNFASDQHYQAENEISRHVRAMTLAGKKHLAGVIADHVKNSEKQAKGGN